MSHPRRVAPEGVSASTPVREDKMCHQSSGRNNMRDGQNDGRNQSRMAYQTGNSARLLAEGEGVAWRVAKPSSA